MTVGALLFDFDGLIVDTEGPSFRSWAELYEQHGHELTIATWSAAVGTVGGFDPEQDLASLGVELAEEHLQGRRQRDLDLCDVEELRPGVIELLDEADGRGIPCAIVSSGANWWIERHLDRHDVIDRFAFVLAANGDASIAKPLPTLYLQALERLGVAPGDAVAFEDSPNGVAAAKAAGIYTVAVPNGVTGTLDLSAADRVFATLLEFELPR